MVTLARCKFQRDITRHCGHVLSKAQVFHMLVIIHTDTAVRATAVTDSSKNGPFVTYPVHEWSTNGMFKQQALEIQLKNRSEAASPLRSCFFVQALP